LSTHARDGAKNFTSCRIIDLNRPCGGVFDPFAVNVASGAKQLGVLQGDPAMIGRVSFEIRQNAPSR
jgi:hypothetical protein